MPLIEFLFRQTVRIQPFLRQSSGEPIYGPEETRRCRLERGASLSSSGHGASGVYNSSPAGAKMFCCGAPIPIGSIVITDERDYVVTNCRIMNGFSDHHLEVTLQ